MHPSIVELRRVTKRYRDVEALAEVSFDLRTGEVFGYLGPNGAGKTTTLKILAGLLARFEGEVRVGGMSIPENHDAVHHWIGFLPQSAGFQDWRTTESALRSLGLLSGVPPDEIDSRITTWLGRFDLADTRRKRIKNLSGGTVQKLALIQALLHEPRLLILDEPLAGLDPSSRALVKDVVRECRARGTTVIFSSHILSDVEDVADRIGILHAGRLLTSGAIAALRAELPVQVGLEFSTPPADVAFLRNGDSGIEEAIPRAPGAASSAADRIADPAASPAASPAANTDANPEGREWTLRLADGADPDSVIHAVIEATLQRGGRLRRIGCREPNLDALYRQYIERAEAGRER